MESQYLYLNEGISLLLLLCIIFSLVCYCKSKNSESFYTPKLQYNKPQPPKIEKPTGVDIHQIDTLEKFSLKSWQ
jgi:hypothetical protein